MTAQPGPDLPDSLRRKRPATPAANSDLYRAGYALAVDELRGVHRRTGSPAAAWAADHLDGIARHVIGDRFISGRDLLAELAAMATRTEQLRSTLSEVLGSFWEKGYPGYEARKSGWIPLPALERWYSALTDGTDQTAPETAPAAPPVPEQPMLEGQGPGGSERVSGCCTQPRLRNVTADWPNTTPGYARILCDACGVENEMPVIAFLPSSADDAA